MRHLVNNLKKLIAFIKNKFYGNIDDRIYLLRIALIFLMSFTCFAIVYRSFFAKVSSYKHVNLHTIYDRNDNLMAYNITTYQINLNPQYLMNLEQIWSQIQHLNLNKEDVLNNIYNKEPFILAKNLELNQVQGIKHPSLNIVKFIKRKYPLEKNFTTIGVCDLQKGIIKGVETLATKNEVHLTIDIRIQNILANVLELNQNKLRPELCFGIIVNLNGEILGMHTTNCTKTDDVHDFFNNILYGLFEYGSTCKIFTAFAGLHYKDFNINTIFDTDEGKKIFDRIITDYTPIPRYSDLYVIISKSSNRGTTAASRKIGRKLVDFLKMLKLDEPVNLGFTTTVKPKFFKKYKDDEILGMGFGYNFMTNALNIIRAFLIIFTNGKILNPTLIKNDKKIRLLGIIKSEVFDIVIDLMRKTASAHPKLDKLGCVSKTGTVDRIINGKYDSHRVNSYIVCAIPGLNGKFAYLMLLGIIDPKDSKQAGWNMREMCAEICERIYSL